MAHLPEWLWVAAGWCAIVLGAWLLLRGRLRSKRRGTRTCPGCGYNLAGLPSRTCPECGRTARSERELLRRRGLKRRRLPGLLILFLGYLSLQTPMMLRHGWAAAAPSWALVRLAPCEGETVADERLNIFHDGWLSGDLPSLGSLFKLPAREVPQRMLDDLVHETFRRFRDKEMPQGAGSVYLRRLARFGPDSLKRHRTWPVAWPWDGATYAPAINPRLRLNDLSVEIDVINPSIPGGKMKDEVYKVVSGRRYVLGIADLPVDTSKGRADFMAVRSSPELDERVWTLMSPRVSIMKDRASVEIGHRPDASTWTGVPQYVCDRIGVTLDGREIGSAECDICLTPGFPGSVYAPIAWRPGGRDAAIAGASRVRVVLVGDPRRATDAWTTAQTEDRTAWSGRVERPVQVKVTLDR